MMSMPGPRAHPTVGSSTPRRPERAPWELRLPMAQSVSLLGVTVAAVVASYVFGFSAGKSVGIDAALDGSLATIAKLPIVPALDSGSLSQDVAPGEVVADLRSETLKVQPPDSARPEKDKEGLSAIQQLKVDADSPPLKEGASQPEEGLVAAASSLPAKAAPSLVPASKEKERVKERERAVEQGADALAAVLDQQTASLNQDQQKAVKAKTEERHPPRGAGSLGSEKPSIQERSSKQLEKGWYAQVAAPTEAKEAKDVAERLRKSGFPIVIEDARVGSVTYYRVLVGPEEGKEPAARLVDQVKRERYLRGEPFLRNVK